MLVISCTNTITQALAVTSTTQKKLFQITYPDSMITSNQEYKLSCT